MKKENVARTSISLPPDILDKLDEYGKNRGYKNRSQTLAEIIRNEIYADQIERGNSLMAGNITLFVSDENDRVQTRVRKVQREYVDEVISCFSVLLERGMRMEILVVQGPGKRLQSLVADLVKISGVQTGKLNLTETVLPPIYERPRINSADFLPRGAGAKEHVNKNE